MSVRDRAARSLRLRCRCTRTCNSLLFLHVCKCGQTAAPVWPPLELNLRYSTLHSTTLQDREVEEATRYLPASELPPLVLCASQRAPGCLSVFVLRGSMVLSPSHVKTTSPWASFHTQPSVGPSLPAPCSAGPPMVARLKHLFRNPSWLWGELPAPAYSRLQFLFQASWL